MKLRTVLDSPLCLIKLIVLKIINVDYYSISFVVALKSSLMCEKDMGFGMSNLKIFILI